MLMTGSSSQRGAALTTEAYDDLYTAGAHCCLKDLLDLWTLCLCPYAVVSKRKLVHQGT